MAKLKPSEAKAVERVIAQPGGGHVLLNAGDRVRIKSFPGKAFRIVEYRGALGPGGKPVYRILLHRRPKPSYVELGADQLELAPMVAIKKVAKKTGGTAKTTLKAKPKAAKKP